MSNYDNTNRGQIWGNDSKQVAGANPNLPDFKGSINVEGKEYWVSGWKKKKESHPKAPALSFKIEAKDDEQTATVRTEPATVLQETSFDDIPF